MMVKHLANCPRRQEQLANAASGKPQTLIHLRVQDGYQNAFWLDVEVRGTATLREIDSYLRRIWLECCGHMSKFTVGGWGGRDVAQSRRVDAVFTDDVELIHIYDFGTESITRIKTVGSRHGTPVSRQPIVLLSRNLAPETSCVECDEPASHLCRECQSEWDSPGTLCTQHAKSHPHDDYGQPIEIVNSPRMGLCGYDGPADPPY
ncbi:hypothetical protein [Luedemannella flava]|uniref:hypothetical protein n=1 Tax=Luedemannella flava TaxID=349316 RepID=UPI0031E349DF